MFEVSADEDRRRREPPAPDDVGMENAVDAVIAGDGRGLRHDWHPAKINAPQNIAFIQTQKLHGRRIVVRTKIKAFKAASAK